MAKLDYILGHSPREIQRLIQQADISRPITERLLMRLNIGPGARVLDLGCGAGDVSMLVAELVGPTGRVIGIDQNAEVLAIATERASKADLSHIVFEHASLESFSTTESFDLVIGRYVLFHQADPIGFLRTAGRLVRAGGIIAFHEYRTKRPFDSVPSVPLWQMIGDFIYTALQVALPHLDIGDRLIESFAEADLPQPELFSETPIGGGPDSPLYAWMAETFHSFLPQLARIGLSLEELPRIDTLESRLRDAVVAARSQVTTPAQVCAWTHV